MKRFLIVLLFVATNTAVWAFDTSFSATDVGYDLYDLIVNKGLNGPIGWVLVGVLVLLGLIQLGKGAAMPAFMGIGAGVLIKALPSIMRSLGMTLDYVQAHEIVAAIPAAMTNVGQLLW